MNIGRTTFAAFFAGLAVLALPASANHGFDTFRFTNKMEGKKAFDIHIEFTDDLSHVQKQDWKDAKCKVRETGSPGFEFRHTVTCDKGVALHKRDHFEISVAPPPPETQTGVGQWWWTGKDGNRVSRKYQKCKKHNGCRDVADS